MVAAADSGEVAEEVFEVAVVGAKGVSGAIPLAKATCPDARRRVLSIRDVTQALDTHETRPAFFLNFN